MTSNDDDSLLGFEERILNKGSKKEKRYCSILGKHFKEEVLKNAKTVLQTVPLTYY